MLMDNSNSNNATAKTALITGGAKRIGATTTRLLHQAGYNVIIHCRLSQQTADELAKELNLLRDNSAKVVHGDLNIDSVYGQLIDQAYQHWGRLDVLINNASSFYPTKFGEIDEEAWLDLIASNFKAPLFLSQACYPSL